MLEFAALFGLGFLLMMFAPQRMKAIEATIAAEPARNGLAGVLGALAAIPLTLMLAVTIIGIPVAIVLWPVVLVVVIPAGVAIVANTVGSKLPTGKLRKAQALVLAP